MNQNQNAFPNVNPVNPEQPPVTPELAQEWLLSTDAMDIFDKPVTINRGSGQETIVINDAVTARKRQPDGSIVREPVVIFQNTNGDQEEMPAESFLQTGDWINQFAKFKESQTQHQPQITFEKEADSANVASPRMSEKQLAYEKRTADLFKPLVRPDNTLEHPGYGHLFSDDPDDALKYEEYSAASQGIQSEQQRYDRFVTEATRKHAADQLVRALTIDKGLDDIVKAHANRIDISNPLNVVDALRTDPELRLGAGKYLLDKVERVVSEHSDAMPERVLANGSKNANGGLVSVNGLRSREYVALLCLAKLDGSFNFDREEQLTDYDSRGVARIGQHRYAAEYVMGTPIDQYPQIEYLGNVALEQQVIATDYDHLFI